MQYCTESIKIKIQLKFGKNVINSISRVEALVSNNGKRIVTIDNWHSLGYGIFFF